MKCKIKMTSTTKSRSQKIFEAQFEYKTFEELLYVLKESLDTYKSTKRNPLKRVTVEII